jgi:hypothetical protein
MAGESSVPVASLVGTDRETANHSAVFTQSEVRYGARHAGDPRKIDGRVVDIHSQIVNRCEMVVAR